jgi:1-aminocyclopropane-1-carboxylate deaminase/D-cysteine desulfhydrase-like pyridoxal-dependent ACC family enzyme
VVVAVGSGGTTAGLLAGVPLAHELGLAPSTPWPVSSRLRLARFAQAVLALVDGLRGASSGATFARLAASLSVDGRFLGKGYGRATSAGARTTERMRAAGAPPLDAVYTAKAAASLLELAARGGPVIFWATKSSSVLPRATDDEIAVAPRALRTWMGR